MQCISIVSVCIITSSAFPVSVHEPCSTPVAVFPGAGPPVLLHRAAARPPLRAADPPAQPARPPAPPERTPLQHRGTARQGPRRPGTPRTTRRQDQIVGTLS